MCVGVGVMCVYVVTVCGGVLLCGVCVWGGVTVWGVCVGGCVWGGVTVWGCLYMCVLFTVTILWNGVFVNSLLELTGLLKYRQALCVPRGGPTRVPRLG